MKFNNWRKLLRNNGLSITLGLLFLLFWVCQAVSGWKVYNQEEMLHGGKAMAFSSYLLCGHFWQATGENWESEFLQMGAYVILTTFLYQKGSAESKDPDEKEVKAPSSGGFLRRNSLSLAFLALFFCSFVIHAEGGLIVSNQQRLHEGLPAQRMMQFMHEPEFWFQSFQNWQSEFLAVFSIVVLSIFLRQQGSPESK